MLLNNYKFKTFKCPRDSFERWIERNNDCGIKVDIVHMSTTESDNKEISLHIIYIDSMQPTPEITLNS